MTFYKPLQYCNSWRYQEECFPNDGDLISYLRQRGVEEAQLSRGKYRNILHGLVYDMHRKFPSVYGVYRNYDEVSKFPYGNLKVNIRNI